MKRADQSDEIASKETLERLVSVLEKPPPYISDLELNSISNFLESVG